MPEILNKSKKSRVYHKGTRYLASQIANGYLCRATIDEDTAKNLKASGHEELDRTVQILLAAHKVQGSGDYMEVKL